MDTEAGADRVERQIGLSEKLQRLGAAIRPAGRRWPHRRLSAHVSTVPW
jgi:hypothetical protein